MTKHLKQRPWPVVQEIERKIATQDPSFLVNLGKSMPKTPVFRNSWAPRTRSQNRNLGLGIVSVVTLISGLAINRALEPATIPGHCEFGAPTAEATIPSDRAVYKLAEMLTGSNTDPCFDQAQIRIIEVNNGTSTPLDGSAQIQAGAKVRMPSYSEYIPTHRG